MANGLTGPEESAAANPVEGSSARDRKGKIVGALYSCMAKNGYAATTLSDIAAEAGMTSSHLLYYYPGKEAILEAFFKAVTKQIEASIAKLNDHAPADKIEAIADLFFHPKGLRKADQGVMLDLYGQAVQNRSMRRIKVAHDRRIKDRFVALFTELSCAPDTTPEEAAQSAYAMLLGLRANSFYDAQLTPGLANQLFKQTLLRLAGIEAPRKAPSTDNT